MSCKLFLITLIILNVLFSANIFSQNKPKLQTKNQVTTGKEMTILVTAYPHGEKQREIVNKLQNDDFAVLENKRSQPIISVKKANQIPLNLAVVIQDNLDWQVSGEIKGLKEFIRNLPEGSRVMTAYLTLGGAIVTQELITDRQQAANSLRIIRSSSLPPSFSPYDGIQTVIKHFEEKPLGRQMILVISDGLDMSGGYNYASPYFSVSLDKAIRDAQRRGISIFTIYAPSEDRKPLGRFAINYGQGSLIRLADETGGESYISGTNLVNLAPYLEEFKQIFPRQWLITYRSATAGNQFRRIEVTTDFDIHLHHPAGYQPKK